MGIRTNYCHSLTRVRVMADDTEANDAEANIERRRADENERLRRLAAEELASMRIELARALEDRVELHRDLNLLAERLSVQADLTSMAQADTIRVQSELDEAADTIQRQAAHITRLKTQMSRPVRLMVKKFVRRARRASGSGNAR